MPFNEYLIKRVDDSLQHFEYQMYRPEEWDESLGNTSGTSKTLAVWERQRTERDVVSGAEVTFYDAILFEEGSTGVIGLQRWVRLEDDADESQPNVYLNMHTGVLDSDNDMPTIDVERVFEQRLGLVETA